MKILSPSFWAGAFMSAFVTMICIYAIKKVNEKAGGLPLINDMVETV